jgi:hypothetical protein
MGVIEHPSNCPDRWIRIPPEILSVRSHGDDTTFPACYFVLLASGEYGLALPRRVNDKGEITWSGNEEFIASVADILSEIGILRCHPRVS